LVETPDIGAKGFGRPTSPLFTIVTVLSCKAKNEALESSELSIVILFKELRVERNAVSALILSFIFDGFESLGYKPQIRALLPKWEVFECGNQLNVIQDLIISKDNSVIKNNKDLCDNGLAATHYMLKWNDNYIDLSGCYKSLSDTIDWKYLTDVAYITPDILTRISSSEVGWNTVFRIEYLDNIKEDIEKAFVKINGILENQKRYQRLILFQESVLLSA
jgi:hypothetical protein